MSKLKKNFLALLFAALLISLVTSITNAGSSPPPGRPPITPPPLTEQDKILQSEVSSFLTSVFRLNMSGYEAMEVITSPSPFGVFVTFKFRSAESKLDVGTQFRNGELMWVMLFPVEGSPAFIKPASSDAISTAKETLNRLQAYSAKDYLPTMRSMVDSVTELKSSKTTVGDLTQEIIVSGNVVTISWEPFANGLSHPQNKLILEFQDGYLRFFCDYLDVYKIGSAEVKISEQEAIRIAMERARAYSWVQDGKTVSNVNVLDSPVIANISLQNRGDNTLYPYWDIWLPLDKMYPGGVTTFHVGIWADTGEVAFISPIGYYGAPNADPSEPQTTPQPASDYGLAIAIALIAATAVIVSYLFYKRKRR